MINERFAEDTFRLIGSPGYFVIEGACGYMIALATTEHQCLTKAFDTLVIELKHEPVTTDPGRPAWWNGAYFASLALGWICCRIGRLEREVADETRTMELQSG